MFNRAYESILLEPPRIHGLAVFLRVAAELPGEGDSGLRPPHQEDRRPYPVLFITAKSTPDYVVTGFELGANDYLKKPFAIQELIVRIKALM